MTTRTKEQSAAATTGNHNFSLISNEKLLQLYATMVKCRMITERARVLIEQNKLTGNEDATVGAESRLEAAAVGVAIDLLPEDTVAPSHRDFIVNFIKGLPLDKIFGPVFARATRPGFAAQINLATSKALANKAKKNGRIAVAFPGDGSNSPSLWHEALALASVQQLPILFVCQNMLPADPLRRKKQTGVEKIAAQACGFPAITVDGNDVVAVYRVATEAIAHARKGNGPTLIECKTGRSTARDPIVNMETYLTRKGLFSEKMKLEVAASFTRELDAAIALLPPGATFHPASNRGKRMIK
jgi:TPP-dependent pyruvate/acetoin dehydrogenase alpha subunit